MSDPSVPVLAVRGLGGPGEVIASLVVGVGRQDETLAEHMLTDLVVALATADAAAGEAFAWGTVGMDHTTIRVSGDRDEVAATLGLLAGALADPPTAGLDAERDELLRVADPAARFDDELPPVDDGGLPDVLVELLRRRFGARGPGLAGFAAPLLDEVDADLVRTWASRWFTTGNAALVVSGDLPLAPLALAPGVAPPRLPCRPLALPTPCFDLLAGGDEVGMSLLVEDSPVGRAAVHALAAALTGRVREDGLGSFALAVDLLALGDGRLHAVLTGPLHGASGPQVAAVLWEEAEDVAAHGAETDAEWQAMLRQVTRAAMVEGDPLDAAETAVAGWLRAADRPAGPAQAAVPDVAEDLSADGLRAVLAEALPSALVVLPGGIGPRTPGLARLRPPVRATAGGRAYKGRLLGPARGASVQVGDEVLTLSTGGSTVVLAWAALAGAAVTRDDDLVLIGPDGGAVHLDAGDWKDGADLVARVLEHLPVGLLPGEG